ncbi:MAG TPA: ureidoglycolate hydrolase [Candidatus Hydrogenedentes bacterium]|nr:ureidoglycolate hydrolase [Candidatus Hydrogenedentota bacterium]HOS01790.1 ureidoglycolate hydrolase [Candidatus Hydrogenedentota bacterium]
MRNATVKELSLESFQNYGTFANMLNPKALKIGEEPIEFFRDMLQLDLGPARSASFSICRVQKRPAVVDVSEYHTGCGEGNLPIDADCLIHVGHATHDGQPPLDSIEIFRVPKGTMVVIKPGVWHHAPFVSDTDCVNVLIVLPERTYANDCVVVPVEGNEQIAVQGA